MGDKHLKLFVGTYTMPIRFGTGQILEGKGRGIYLIELDENTGILEMRHVCGNIDNPSYLALAPDGRHLYTVNELKQFEGENSGAVSAFFVNADGTLDKLNQMPTGGTDPCYVTMDQKGKNLYIANFMSGSVAGFALEQNGSLGVRHSFFQHQGRGLLNDRQAGPHAHSVVFTLDGQKAFVPDLGLDRLVVYQVDSSGQLRNQADDHIQLPPGSGPRYGVFSRDGRFGYFINELSCSITVFQCDSSWELQAIQTVSSIPEGEDVNGSICAHLALTPDGRFLYGSNRGHDSLSLFCVNKDGSLDFLDNCSCKGKTPRHFCITPSGRYLLCANQDSDQIICFSIDDTGKLSQVSALAVPTPVCILPWHEQ